ncbi:MAG TPA: type II toxin-antitoxin system VapB family antitoxin [Terriglobales bacterium]|nr:type II toxin-antitoxin system VapB family antitoxin [Terriglobales bacterium]
MSLTITDPETERLARLLAEETGEPVTVAIQKSLRERLDRLSTKGGRPVSMERLLEIADRVATLPVRDNLTADEILGYDEHGLPR